MYRLTAKLLIYRNIGQDSILMQLSQLIQKYEAKDASREDTIAAVYTQIHRLLDVATDYGFDENLWQDYLSYLLATTENPFSITCEKRGAWDGTVNQLAKEDFACFIELFSYDFSELERELGINCFKTITNYQSLKKSVRFYNKPVSDKVRALSDSLKNAKTPDEFFLRMTEFYHAYGVGLLGLNKAFRLSDTNPGQLIPISNTGDAKLSDLVGYEIQKKKLVDNTKAFLEGKKANNVLLYGDSGTGKSTSIKAILNEYYLSGLRVIEVYKHQFEQLSTIISMIKNRNYKFIIYMDDLSFEEFEIEYKYLKAVIEGGLEVKPDNVLIYATSNRRHLIKETWDDRSDMSKNELHHSDTMQEKLSLVARFGITISYSAPTQKEYYEIVDELSKPYNYFGLSPEELNRKASAWEMQHGGLSGRTASQFVIYMQGQID